MECMGLDEDPPESMESDILGEFQDFLTNNVVGFPHGIVQN